MVHKGMAEGRSEIVLASPGSPSTEGIHAKSPFRQPFDQQKGDIYMSLDDASKGTVPCQHR